MVKVLGDYGSMGGKWHITRDAEGKTISLVQGKK
jgi:hypothetical protein